MSPSASRGRLPAAESMRRFEGCAAMAEASRWSPRRHAPRHALTPSSTSTFSRRHAFILVSLSDLGILLQADIALAYTSHDDIMLRAGHLITLRAARRFTFAIGPIDTQRRSCRCRGEGHEVPPFPRAALFISAGRVFYFVLCALFTSGGTRADASMA